MKKILLLFALCALVATPVAAQDELPEKAPKKVLEPLKLRHRISFSYGDGMGLNLGGAFNHFPGLLSGTSSNYDAVNTAGSFNFDYLYMSKSGRWGFGGGVSLTPLNFWKEAHGTHSFSQLMLSIAPRVQCTYFRSKLVELYGTASVGVMFSVSAIGNNICALAWQVDPIGVRVGTERIAGFVSVGWGSRGMVGLGIQVGL